jgi:hypothetical protein
VVAEWRCSRGAISRESSRQLLDAITIDVNDRLRLSGVEQTLTCRHVHRLVVARDPGRQIQLHVARNDGARRNVRRNHSNEVRHDFSDASGTVIKSEQIAATIRGESENKRRCSYERLTA